MAKLLIVAVVFVLAHAAPAASRAVTIPAFTLGFLTDGEHLVPAACDLVGPGAVRVILSPGRV